MKKIKRILSVALCLFVVAVSLSFNISGEESAGRKTVRITTTVNVRSAPGTWNPVVEKLNPCIVESLGIELDKDQDPWFKIKTPSGAIGYVYSSYVVIEGETFIVSSSDFIKRVYLGSAQTLYKTYGVGAQSRTTVSGYLNVYDEVSDVKGEKWYFVISPNGKSGYIKASIVSELSFNTDANFEQTLSAFPDNYRDGLRYLHSIYPNWKFTAENVSVSLNTAISNEVGSKMISTYNMPPDNWHIEIQNKKPEPGYYWASDLALKYFMSPENFFDPDNVFMFLDQSFNNANDNSQTLKSILQGSFLNTDEYINILLNSAKSLGISSAVLAGTLIQEQGWNGTSDLISGKYPGYEGYYNFFNVGASGETEAQIIKSGLEHAKLKGWNTKEKAITEGASYLANGYINAGQNSYYYTDFNVKKQVWWHQYATNIDDARAKASLLSKGFVGQKSATLNFVIPVFKGSVITPILPPPVKLKLGDVNNDNVIDAVDLAAVKLHILGIRVLTGNTFTQADINSDSVIDAVDLAAVKLDILGIRKIS